MWEGLDSELKALIVKSAIAALGFASLLGALVARKVYTWVEIIADAKITEAKATAARRLALAGELSSAATEEEARATGIRGAAKAELAATVAAKLLEVPAKVETLTADDPAVKAAVRAGVTKLRASIPAPSTYVLTASEVPRPVDVVGLPPPARVPAIEERPTPTAQRAPKPRG